MMSDLLLHPRTQQLIDSAIARRVHALLLIGPQGAGKGSLLRYIAATALDVPVDKLINEPRYLSVVPDGKSVTIDQTRELQHFLTLKTTGTGEIRRVITIESADTMTRDAQNALLKTLEEPPTDTILVLSATQAEDILPTIRSRSQAIFITPPSMSSVVEYFAQTYAREHIERAYNVSGGYVGLLTSLLDGESENGLMHAIDQAKQLLSQPPFERLTHVDELSKQKEELTLLLVALKRICSGALGQAATKGQQQAAKAWHARLMVVAQAEEAFARNANAKLLLTDLFLHL